MLEIALLLEDLPNLDLLTVVSPIIVLATHLGCDRVHDPREPLPTVACANRGDQMRISPTLIGLGAHPSAGRPADADAPQISILTYNHPA